MATAAERMAKKRARDKGKGLVQVTLTVPKDKVETLRTIAEAWETEHRAKSLRQKLAEQGQQDLLTFLETTQKEDELPVTGDTPKTEQQVTRKRKRNTKRNEPSNGESNGNEEQTT